MEVAAGFTGCGKTPVLYQGTTSVAQLENTLGFSPWGIALLFAAEFFRSLFSPLRFQSLDSVIRWSQQAWCGTSVSGGDIAVSQ